MTAGAEDIKTGEWLKDVLSAQIGNAVSGYYFGVVPEEAELPAIRFHVQGQVDVRGATRGTQRILTRLDWLVVVVNSGLALAPLVPIVVGIDQALHEQTGETDEIEVESCVRLEPFNLLPDDALAGQQYQRQAGGLYRTMVKAK